MMLVAAWMMLAAYTAAVIKWHGVDLLPIFFGDIGRLAWPGQFNLDFLCFLMLSALWTAWRNEFSPMGLVLALLAFFGGAGFLLPYLLFLTIRTGGDMAILFLGARRQSGMTTRSRLP